MKTRGLAGAYRRIAVYMALVIILAGCSSESYREASWDQFSSAKPVVLSSAEAVKEVEAMISAIDRLYAHRHRKGVTAQGLRDVFLPRVEKANDMGEVNGILLEMFASLQNGHANVYTFMGEFGVPVGCSLIEEKLIITNTNYNLLADEGVSLGWEIRAIEGQPAMEWLMERGKYISASTPQARLRGAVDRAFMRYEFDPTVRSYEFMSPQGQVVALDIALTIPRHNLRSPRQPIETWMRGDIGYIAINTMTDGIVERFDSALQTMIDKKGLILDLRFNGGGNSMNGDAMIKRLIQKETSIWANRKVQPHTKLSYSGDIVVLVNAFTFSAAESFAFDLYDSGRVTVMGEPTGGDSGGGPKLFTTSGGIFFRFPTRGVDLSASGLFMEGTGLEPHIRVTQTLEDLLANKDTVLEAAMEYLQRR